MKNTVDRDPEIAVTLLVTIGALTAATYLAASKLHQVNENDRKKKRYCFIDKRYYS